MATWIFQGNPDEYDIDGYLASRPASLVWLATRYAAEIAIGDRVYLWRNQGKTNAIAGIVAEAVVTARPELRDEDPEGVKFWRTESPRATAPQVRAVMRLVKVASTREVLRKIWLEEDPILKELPNIRMPAGTNYPVPPDQAERIAGLWSRTGRDWSYAELIAGLKIYSETFGQPVSKLPGSPVARVALMTGRAVTGVYAKVMNFRFLDPRSEGKGMSRAGGMDATVWQQFFDPASSQISDVALALEFQRLWGEPELDDALAVLPDVNAVAATVAIEADKLQNIALDDLLAKYRAQSKLKPAHPSTRLLSARAYERDPLVIAIAQVRASHMCEIPSCDYPSFETPKGRRYTEVHHVVPLAVGGADTIENVACLCPTHHREIHLGARSTELTEHLLAVRHAFIAA